MFDVFTVLIRIKRRFIKKDAFFLVLIISLYFITRLINLTKFPIFTDEGIYIHWAKVAWHDASWRFISLTDGRQPLQTWLTIPFLKLFPDNALLAGRLFGVFSGFFALSGIFALAYYLFGKKVAYITSFLYIITPFYLFFDRLAMVDSLVNASFVWLFLFSILLVRTLRFDVTLIFGLLSGFFLLAKSSVSLFLGLAIFAPILTLKKNLKSNIKPMVNFIILFGMVILLSFLIYNVQRLSPFLHFVGEKNKTFVRTFDEVIKEPFTVFWYNFSYIPIHLIHNLGWATFIFGLFGFYLIFKNKKSLVFYFLIWMLIPCFIMLFFMRVLYSRYFIFLLTPFVIFAAYFFSVRSKRSVVWPGLLLVSYIFTFYFNYTILFHSPKIPFLPDDRGQYIESWTSGYGAKEIVDYVREKSKEKPVILLAEGNFGMAGDVLDVFLKKDDRITIKGYWPLNKENIIENKKFLSENFVYAVFAHRENFPLDWPIKLIDRFDKPGNKSSIFFFQVQEK